MTNTEVITIKAIDETLAQPVYSFLRLPGVDIEVSKALQQALDEFQSVDNVAGRDAARWLQRCALPEYETSRTTLLLGHGRIAGFHSLASQHVEMDSDERGLIGLRADRARVPATLMTWIAKDPRAGASGKELFLHAVASSRKATEFQASAILVLDAYDDETAAMWLNQPYGLRQLSKSRKPRLWLPLGAES